MPGIIPRTGPTLNRLSTDAGASLQRDSGAFGSGITAIGEQVSEVGDMLLKANLLAEETKAENQLSASMSEIRSRAAKDPDTSPERQAQYDEEVSRAIGEAAENFSRPLERSTFELQGKGRAEIFKNQIDGMFWKKKVDVGRAQLDINLQRLQDDFVLAKRPAEKEMLVIEREKKIDKMVEAGYLSPAEGVTLRAELPREWSRAQVERDIREDPNTAKALLDKSAYPDLTEDDRLALSDIAQAQIEFQAKQEESAQKLKAAEVNEELGWKSFDKTLTLGDIEDAREFLTPAQAKAHRDSLKPSTKIDPVTANLNYADFSDRFNKLGVDKDDGAADASFEELSDFRADVLRAAADGRLMPEDARKLFRDTNVVFEAGMSEAAEAEVKKKNSAFQNITNALTFWADENANDIEATKARMRREFSDRVANGDDPQQAKDEIIEAERDNIDPTWKNYKKDDIIQTPLGPAKVVGFFPSGEPDVELIGG